MRFTGEIIAQELREDSVWVTIAKIKRVGAPEWDDYHGPLALALPLGRAGAFRLGRGVAITLTPDPIRRRKRGGSA